MPIGNVRVSFEESPQWKVGRVGRIVFAVVR